MSIKKIISMVSALALAMTGSAVTTLVSADEDTQIGFFEDFEGYEEISDTYTLVDIMNDLYADGWSVATDNKFTARNESDKNQKFAQIVKDGDNKVLELTTSKALGRMLEPSNETPSGSYEISFKFKPVDLGKPQMLFDLSLNSFNETTAVAKHNILYSYNGIKMGHRTSNIGVPTSIVGTAEDVWYDVKCVVNNDGGYYSVELYKEGEFVARRGGINYAGEEKIGFLKLSGFGTTIYVDDVSIKPCEPETLIYEDNFDSYKNVVPASTMLSVGTDVSEAQSREGDCFFDGYSPWRALRTFGNTYDLVYDELLESQVVRLGDDTATSVQESTGMILMPLEGEYLTKDTQTKRGKLRLTYKFKHYSKNGYASAIDIISSYNYNSKWDYPPQLAIQEKGLPRPAVAGLPYLRTSDAPVKIEQSMWYDAEVIFDVINDDVTIIVKENSTGKEIAHFTHDTNWINPGVAPTFDKVKAINFRAMSGSSVYIDDVRLEYYIPKPEISGNRVIITDYRDESVTDKNNVPAAIKSIELPFDSDMTKESTNPDTVTFKDNNGNSVSYSPVYSSGSYTIIPDGFLTAGKTYTITVPATAVNTFGYELGKTFEYSFTVSSESPELMTLASTSIAFFSDVVNGSEITAQIEYANTSDEELNGMPFVAYYGDDMLLATSSANLSPVGAGEMGKTTVSFTVPSSEKLDMNKVDRISVCLWKGFKNSAPYCRSIDATNNYDEKDTTANATSSKPVVTYSYNDSVLNISGKADDGGKYLTVQILKPGNTFDAGDELTADAADDTVFYRAQVPVKDGAYSLDIRFDTKGNTASTLVAGDYPTAMYLDDKKLDIDSVYLSSYADFADVYSTLNSSATSDDFETFKNILNTKRSALNFNSKLLGDADVGNEIRPYFEYVKKNPLNAQDEANNAKMFNTYVVIEQLNSSKIDNVKDEISNLLISDDVKTLCTNSLTTNEKGKYFTSLILGKSISDPKQLESKIKEAIILTAAKYGNGYGELKSALVTCGLEIGIKTPISDAACRSLMGKTFKDSASFKTAYNSALSAAQNSSQSGSGGGGGGGGSTNKTPTVASVQMSASDYTPSSSLTPVQKTFNDIDNYEWAMPGILALADRNIINGVAEDRFDPSRNITREEFAKILVGALGASDYAYSNNVFSDAKDSDWFVKYINVAAQLGIVKGVGNGVFGTGNNITRQDMAVMIYNALKYRNANMSTGTFRFDDDAQIAGYAKDAVGALHELGAINGVTETTFAPTGLATRAQAAKIIYSVLKGLQG